MCRVTTVPIDALILAPQLPNLAPVAVAQKTTYRPADRDKHLHCQIYARAGASQALSNSMSANHDKPQSSETVNTHSLAINDELFKSRARQEAAAACKKSHTCYVTTEKHQDAATSMQARLHTKTMATGKDHELNMLLII